MAIKLIILTLAVLCAPSFADDKIYLLENSNNKVIIHSFGSPPAYNKKHFYIPLATGEKQQIKCCVTPAKEFPNTNFVYAAKNEDYAFDEKHLAKSTWSRLSPPQEEPFIGISFHAKQKPILKEISKNELLLKWPRRTVTIYHCFTSETFHLKMVEENSDEVMFTLPLSGDSEIDCSDTILPPPKQ